MIDDIKKLSNLFFQGNAIPKDLRLFLVADKEYLYVNKGHVEHMQSASKLFQFTTLDRGKILDHFAKFDFLINELIRLMIVGFEYEKGEKLIDILSKMNLSPRISLLQDWKILNKVLTKNLISLMEVRNGLAHKFSISEVNYKGRPLSNNHVLREFSADLVKNWDELVETYEKESSKIDVKQLIKKIEDFRNPPSQ